MSEHKLKMRPVSKIVFFPSHDLPQRTGKTVGRKLDFMRVTGGGWWTTVNGVTEWDMTEMKRLTKL